MTWRSSLERGCKSSLARWTTSQGPGGDLEYPWLQGHTVPWSGAGVFSIALQGDRETEEPLVGASCFCVRAPTSQMAPCSGQVMLKVFIE